MKDITFFYIPEAYKDVKTGKLFEVLRPKIPVRLSINHNVSKILVDCLFDTGADRNLFPAGWGRSLGLKLEKGKLVKTIGIGGKVINAYAHQVTLFIQGHKIETEAGFTDENNTPLLGRIGFMDKFDDIVINEKKKFVRLSFK